MDLFVGDISSRSNHKFYWNGMWLINTLFLSYPQKSQNEGGKREKN